ncbi:outer membrane autotransporter barrel domain-containing protein [Leptotrichia trevisanii]|uniref:S8 family serine peptidase n=1 Tax=Leptotrichia trevisanii TaxID=109328 RepID=UPI00118CB019|nr:autotransporter domain-containing protein [Leptotrichia trevisanii]BBM58202.1 outer membrane autotransporter barrel domain-containing protein [Leptotrichia trevisanii]
MKKILLLISLITVLSSCGGGGGGGGGGNNSSSPTPLPSPSNPRGENGSQNPNNSNNQNNPNHSSKIQPGSSNNGGNPSSQNPQGANFTGRGVDVAVLDSDFLSSDVHTNQLYNKQSYIDEIIDKEFKDRFVKEPMANTTYLSKNDHGILVATILGGNSGTGATGAKIHGVSVSQGSGFYLDVNKYQELQNRGVRIYSHSFGTQEGFRTYSNYKEPYRIYLRKLGETITIPENDNRVDALTNFYRNAVNQGSLFIWAAGNRKVGGQTMDEVSIQAGLPHYIPSLHKGWIAVMGVRPDGSEYNPHLARAGGAKWWTVAASGECGLPGCAEYGSSFATPKVSATAAKLKEKFPWMTGHEIQQTILTTATDLGDPGVDTKFGWGLLNEKKALKGPAAFSSELLVGESAASHGARGEFNANIGNNITSKFENDITGLGGLKKSGNGTLILAGNNDYQGATTIEGGTLEIQKENGSPITIKSGGTLVTTPTTVIGLRNYSGNFSPINVKNEGGTLENRGSGAVITGNYEATAGSVTKAQIGSKLIVKGTVNLNGGNATLQTLSNGRYITAKPLSSTVIEAEKGINGSFDKVETPELINGAVETVDNKVNVKLSRKNMVDYVEKIAESDEMQKTTAENLETAFQKLDQNIENGTAGNVAQFERKAAKLQALTSSNRAAVLDSLSGQIYASAQALTFQHSQTVNKDLSNRLVMLGTLDNVGDNFGLWISGFGANGKLKQDGYGKGDTKVAGGQVGVDKQFGENLILGTALSYSKADVKFDRYGGKSDANNFGVSLYGRLGNKNVPFYLQGRFGIGFVDSDVERDIILSNNDFTRAKINHNDKVYSGYLETGYHIKNDNGDFVVTPFVGLTHDTVVRGSFSEEKSQFGLTADKKNYNQTAALLGLRVGKAVNWNDGSKTTFQGYVTHQRAFNDQDLSFDARYTGLPGATFKVKGIGLSKNRTWVGVGALTEVNSGFGWYVNYDGSIDSGKGKGNNNVFTTGLRFNF